MTGTIQISGKSRRLRTAINIISMLAVFVFMLVLNSMLPYISDDVHFKFVWMDFYTSENDRPMATLADIIESCKNYYNMSGGRVILHFLCFFFVMLPKPIFNIVNSFFFVLLGIVTYKIAALGCGENKQPPLWLLPLIYGIYLLDIQCFGDNCLWLSGSINYLWSCVLLLADVYLIIKYIPRGDPKTLLLCAFPIMLSAALNETTGGILLLTACIVLIRQIKQKYMYIIYMAICTIPGMLLVILAPGNQSRLDYENITSLFEPLAVFKQFYMYLSVFRSYNSNIINILTVIILFEIFVSLKKKKSLLRLLADNAAIFAGIAGVLALSLLGFYSDRPMILGYVVFLAGALKTVLSLPEYINELKGENLKEIIRLLLKTATAVLIVTTIRNRHDEGIILWGICALLTGVTVIISKNVEISPSDLVRIKKAYGFISGKSKYILCVAAVAVCAFIMFRLGSEFRIYRENIAICNDYLAEIVITEINDPEDSFMFAKKYMNRYDLTGRLLPNTLHKYCLGEFYISWYKKYYEYYVKPNSKSSACVTPDICVTSAARCLSSR